jgi:hypothetical protein
MLIMAAPSDNGGIQLPSRTVTAQPTCAAQVAADMGGSWSLNHLV